ncbi:general stress protein [Oceanobacillus damuensis]|uniref:general stress protein n=1 Tax=Oceanobacillus damuensis TaxID=937928 RepID=UPI00082CBCE6|nr:general stress protein [Oceanobacillus damuensis]
MAKHIIGAYKSEEEAIQAIGEFKLAGYTTTDLTILADRKSNIKKGDLESFTDVNIEKGPYVTEDASFWDKIKKVFKDEGTLDVTPYEQLVKYGVDKEEAEKYTSTGEQFNLFLIADELIGTSSSDSAFHHNPEVSTNLDEDLKRPL